MLDRRRWFILALVATLSLTGLAACDDDGEDAQAALTADNEEEVTEAIEALGQVPDEGDVPEPVQLQEEKSAGIQQEAPEIPQESGLVIDPAILQSQLGAWIQTQVGPFTLDGVTVDQEAIDKGAMEALELDYSIVLEDGNKWNFSHWMELHSTPDVAAFKKDERVAFFQGLDLGWVVTQTFTLQNAAGEQLGSGTLLTNDLFPQGLQAVVWHNGDRLMVAAGPRGAEFYDNSKY